MTIAGLGMIASVTENEATWQIANLHGDTVATVSGSPANGMASYAETDEYGDGGAQDGRRYGYLGTHQRATGTDTLGGIVLMGARLYNPSTGLFMSSDPVLGGNDNRYDYPSSPVSDMDTTGKYRISYWKTAPWWSPVKYWWIKIKFSNNEAKRMAWGAGVAGAVIGMIATWVPWPWKVVLEVTRWYAWYISSVSGWIHLTGRCGTIVTGGYFWGGLRVLFPTVWGRRCGT